jgi:hypothetical protein
MSSAARQENSFLGRTPEETLLINLGHEVMNFRPGFPKSKLKNTFVLSVYGSAMFGLMPKDGMVYLGIPKRFYERFRDARWLYAAKITGQPGLFLVMQLGTGGNAQPIALRLFVRSRRLDALTNKITSLRAVPMNREGITREDDLLQGFNLKFLVLNEYTWEKAAQTEDF